MAKFVDIIIRHENGHDYSEFINVDKVIRIFQCGQARFEITFDNSNKVEIYDYNGQLETYLKSN